MQLIHPSLCRFSHLYNYRSASTEVIILKHLNYLKHFLLKKTYSDFIQQIRICEVGILPYDSNGILLRDLNVRLRWWNTFRGEINAFFLAPIDCHLLTDTLTWWEMLVPCSISAPLRSLRLTFSSSVWIHLPSLCDFWKSRSSFACSTDDSGICFQGSCFKRSCWTWLLFWDPAIMK